MTRESNRCVPSSSTSTGSLPSGLYACTGLPGFHGDIVDELALDLLLGERDAHLARVRTGGRGDELEHGDASAGDDAAEREIIASRASAAAPERRGTLRAIARTIGSRLDADEHPR